MFRLSAWRKQRKSCCQTAREEGRAARRTSARKVLKPSWSIHATVVAMDESASDLAVTVAAAVTGASRWRRAIVYGPFREGAAKPANDRTAGDAASRDDEAPSEHGLPRGGTKSRDDVAADHSSKPPSIRRGQRRIAKKGCRVHRVAPVAQQNRSGRAKITALDGPR